MFGWSILEGIGAALVLPAMVALVASNFRGQDRALAYGVLGGVAGAGIAVGPILGGWATTELSWRVVFAGEVAVVIGILLGMRLIKEPERTGPVPKLDWVGGLLSAAGLGIMVLGVLQASNWGWLLPKSGSPVPPFGLALTPFVIAAGALVLAGFRAWERRREESGEEPLVHLELLSIPRLRGGLSMLLSQNLVLMGVFFTVPLFLQIVQGLDALETGVRMLPASIGLFVTALAGARLAKRFPARTLVRAGLGVVLARRPASARHDRTRARQHCVPGRHGRARRRHGPDRLPARQCRPVGGRGLDRSEAGGLQYTAQQLGSSLGTALLGAIVISGLVRPSPRTSPTIRRSPTRSNSRSASRSAPAPASSPPTRSARRRRPKGVDPATTENLVGHYEDAQLDALRIAFLAAALLVVASFFATSRLPTRRFDELEAERGPPATA